MWMSDLAGPSLPDAPVSAWAARVRKNESSVSPSPPTKPTCRNDRRVGRAKCAGSSNQVPRIVELFISVLLRNTAGGVVRQAGHRMQDHFRVHYFFTFGESGKFFGQVRWQTLATYVRF